MVESVGHGNIFEFIIMCTIVEVSFSVLMENTDQRIQYNDVTNRKKYIFCTSKTNISLTTIILFRLNTLDAFFS